MSDGRWSVRSSRIVLADRWLTVRADECATPEGAVIAPYYVLDYPDWAHVVAIDDAGHLLMVEQYRHGLGSMSLDLPGGGVEPADSDAQQAARRELLEETGYGGGRWRQIATLAPNPSNQSNRVHTFLAEGVTLQATPVDDEAERVRLVRLPLADVAGLAMNGKVMNAMYVASLALVLGPMGFWRA